MHKLSTCRIHDPRVWEQKIVNGSKRFTYRTHDGSAMNLQEPLEPLPIPPNMPIKTTEEVLAKYDRYMTKDSVGRVAVKLAINTYALR